jgi:hypothetical protein
MTGLAWALMGGLLVGGAFVLAHWLRALAEDRAREARYADEWVRRHRKGDFR